MRKKSLNIVKVYYPKFNLEEIIKRIRKRLKKGLKKIPIKTVILFGSYAKGNYTVASDIDLLIIYEDPKIRNDYSICWDLFKIPQLELHVYTESEYEKLKNSFMAKEIEKNGIIVWKKLNG